MYIVLEGIDGSGKSTQIQLLKENLENKGYNVTVVEEPTDSDIGQIIRERLKDPEAVEKVHQIINALLFAADRLTHKKLIDDVKHDPENIIISDRSYLSSIAYQNDDVITTQWIEIINKYMPKPDLTILLDINEKEALKRCADDVSEAFEYEEFLKITREKYLKLSEFAQMKRVDASLNRTKLQDKILGIIYEELDI
ncbi:dTMP kinase [Methanosphaera cuniculi]|uniref:dTMP kinase n=1 Tax=Methanosphaera cuniculi TaxID=1077256 RepID=UPI0026DD2988|nr:dTMP kinase [Methanosphaera cuniculi]